MDVVKSRDGTPIAYERAGSGPPLVLVHGSTSDHDTAYRFVIPMLDRRGRGESGDGVDYCLERELDDVVAVIESAGEPVNLFGHGFGALVTLEASQRTGNVRKLGLYEGGITASRSTVYPPGTVERMETFLEDGNRDGVVVTFMTDIITMSTDDLAVLRSQPRWLERNTARSSVDMVMMSVMNVTTTPSRLPSSRNVSIRSTVPGG